jgi:uncharacterized protein (TIGR03067 family)
MQGSLLLVVAIILAAPAPKVNPKSDPDIVGKWVLITIAAAGRDAGPITGGPVRTEMSLDGKVTNYVGEKQVSAGRYVVDKKVQPQAIDYVDGDTKELGIYKLEKNTLTICYAGVGEPRPVEFTAPADTARRVIVLIRIETKKD